MVFSQTKLTCNFVDANILQTINNLTYDKTTSYKALVNLKYGWKSTETICEIKSC